MPVAGEQYTPHLDVAEGDPTTTVTLTVIDPDDNDVDVVITADDASGQAFTGDEITLGAGEYLLAWTVTGPGATRQVQRLYVDPDPVDIPAGFTFATTGDLARYTGKATTPGARRILVDASREIDRVTKTARYRVDPAGRPTDPDIAAALRDATCELVGWWEETGTATGGRALFTSASIAGVSLGFGGQGQGTSSNPQADRVGPRVWTILLNAGLTGGAVTSGG